MTAAVVFNFVRVFEDICTICPENFHTEYGKCVAPVLQFAETFNKEVSGVLCEKTYHSCGILNCLGDSEHGKRTVCKKCARKIVNCYKEQGSTRRKTYSFKCSRSQTPSTACPSS